MIRDRVGRWKPGVVLVRRAGAGRRAAGRLGVALGLLAASPLVLAGTAEATSLAVNRVIMLSAAGSAVDNCQGLLNRLAAITDATADRPYLLRLEPGAFECSTTVKTKPFVDLEGAGEGLTVIRGEGEMGLVDVANDSEIRHLTVSAVATGQSVVAVFPRDRATLRHVTVRASGATISNLGVFSNSDRSPKLHDVTIEVTDPGAEHNYGLYAQTSAPQLYNVYITAGGADNSYGIYADGADTLEPTNLRVQGSTIYASGQLKSHGIHSYATGDPVIVEGSTVRVSGGLGDNHAVHNRDAPLTVRNSTLEASGIATKYWAVMNDRGGDPLPPTGNYVVTIDNSQIIGETGTVMSEADFDTFIGGSLLSGGAMSIDASASVQCAGVWDEGYVFTSGPGCP